MDIINVMAASLDGHIALCQGESDEERAQYGFSIPEDKEFVRAQILSADAIITGAESMRASSGTWQQVGRAGHFPTWVVLTRRGLEKDLLFWRQREIPRVIVSSNVLTPDQMVDPSVEFWHCPNEEDIAQFVSDKLQARGCQRVLLFGGGHINNLFYKSKLVKELYLTLCPFILGREAAPLLLKPELPSYVKLRLMSSLAIQSHVFLKYSVES